jgi:Tripartite tricarboxylate transporter TctB family
VKNTVRLESLGTRIYREEAGGDIAMEKRDYPDVVAGAGLFGLGLFVAVYAAANYDLGTIRNMQAGMFPMSVGSILSVLGLLIAVPALKRQRALPRIEWRPLLGTLASVATFALTATRFGMIPAVILLTIFAALSDSQLKGRQIASLAMFLVLLSVGIFHFGLGLQIPLVTW